MNFFADEYRNNIDFQKKYISSQTQKPAKKYRCICPLFTRIRNYCSECNCYICSCSCSCCSCNTERIRSFIKNHPYCFYSIIGGIILFIIILIIIIAVSVKKSKKGTEGIEGKESTDYIDILKNIGDNDKGTLTQFCDYLSAKASNLNEEQKVNLAYKWITENIEYDEDGSVERDPEKFFPSKTTVCSGFAHLFYRMLKAMNYNEDNIRNITGYAKGSTYSVYEEPTVEHEWNAVKINGKWCLIDATWDAGQKEYRYFCTKPECFVRDHLPQEEEKENQFLDNPISLQTYHNYVLTTGLFCKYNVEIKEDISIYNKCNGKFTVKYNYDSELNLYISPEENIEIDIAYIDKGFDVNFKASQKGKYNLVMFLVTENIDYTTSIGTVHVNCE